MAGLNIRSTTSLSRGHLVQDGSILATGSGSPEEVFRAIYQALDLNYPKFHKMDPASKLAFLTVEPLIAAARRQGADVGEELGLLGMSHSGSAVSDRAHWSTFLDTGTASPALFVYTLPNIGLGEITIRHGIHGVSLCLLGRGGQQQEWTDAVRAMHQQDGMRWIVCLWSDIFADRYEARAVLLGPGHGPAADEAALRDLFTPAT